ncbi:MAG TPA: poly-gamma-glutamate biosynthesis protein PgsC/CapC [bacterium]|nr:poly-gamma-glutamate biosynthesis protein PgsC/CapC [bacterium]
MASDLALHLIPNRSLDQFLYLPVLVGVLIVFFFTEVYGWQFVGLVVPGYLAAVFCIQPQAGITIIAEGLVTLALARVVSDLLSRSGTWTTLFGRDRFFLIILLSVLVRQQTEIVWLPVLSDFLARHYGLDLHLERNYFSVALVLVPLVANSFWNLSFKRGAVQLVSSVLITFLVLRLVFIPSGILSLSRLELVYLDYELSFRALAKAYILLLIGAGLSSRWNLEFGWDYNGIVVPALMALCWITPLRFASTIVESMMLVVIVRGIESLPFLATTNLEGPRKMVLVYTLSVALKLVAARLLADPFLGFGFADLFGFGHLLPSLIAVKMLERKEMRTILLPVVSTSLLAFVLGSALGVALDAIAPAPRPPDLVRPMMATRTLLESAAGVLSVGEARARTHELDDEALRLRGDDRGRYAALMLEVDAWLARGGDTPAAVAARAKALGLSVVALPARPGTRAAYAMLETEERLAAQRGFDTALLFPGAPGPMLDVAHPATQSLAADAALPLCERVACRAIVLAGDEGASRPTPYAGLRAPVVRLRIADPGGTAATLATRAGAPAELAGLWPGATAARFDARDDAEGELAIAAPLLIAELESHAPAPPKDASSAETLAAAPGSYRAPSETESRAIGAVASGVLAARAEGDDHARATLIALARVRAARLGMRVTASGTEIVLADGAGHGWPALQVHVGKSQALAFEVPHPARDVGADGAGADLYRETNATALLLAGSSLQGEVDGDPDPTRFGAFSTPFQGIHEALSRALPSTGAIVSVRGLGARRAVDADAVLGTGVPLLDEKAVPAAATKLFDDGAPLAFLAARRKLADGSAGAFGLDGGGTPQVELNRRFELLPVTTLWLSDDVLEAWCMLEFRATRTKLAAIGLPFRGVSAADALLVPALARAGSASKDLERKSGELARLAHHASDPALARACAAPACAATTGFSFELGLPFAVVEARAGTEVVRTLVLGDGAGADVRVEADDPAVAAKVEDALARRAGSITLHGSLRTVARAEGAP